MTITEEIYDAMKAGANSMFLIGLLRLASTEQGAEEAMNAINVAGEKLRRMREVRLSHAELLFQAQGKPRRHEPELEQEW